MNYDNERRDEDWINPPDEKEEVEPDVDAMIDRLKEMRYYRKVTFINNYRGK